MQRLLIAALLCLAVGSAHADSLVRNIVTNATTPLPSTSFFYIDQNGTDAKLAGTNLLAAMSGGTANAFLTAGGAGVAPNSVPITGLVLGNGASAPGAYGGTSCTNQFPRSLSAVGAATCASVAIGADVSGLGTGIATALAVNTGTAGSVVINGGVLGTPSSGTLTNLAGLPIGGITGLGAGVATWLATPTGANLTTALSSGGGTTNFLRADGNFAAPAGGGNVTAGGTLTSNQLVIGQGTTAVAALGSLGTTTTVLHGNAAGSPTFAAVAIGADVSGLGTGVATALAVNTGTAGSFLVNGGALAGSSLTSTGLIKTTGADGSQLEIAGGGLTDFKLSVNASGFYINDVTNSKSPLIVSPNSPNSLTIGASTNAFVGPVTDGANGGTVGSLKLFGNTSGDVTVVAAAAAGTATRFQLPATNGSNTNVLQTDGSGNTSWVAAAAGSGTVTQNGNLTTHAPVIGGTNGTSDVKTTAALTNGQLLIGSTGADAAPGTVAAGTANLAWTVGAGTLSLATKVPLNAQSGNSAYTIVAGDNTKAVSRTNTVTQSDIIPQATGSFASGFAFGYSTGASVGNTLTATTSTVNGIAGATGIKVGIEQEIGCNSDGTNWACMLGLPQPATQTGTTVLLDNMTWGTNTANPTATAGTAAVNGTATTYMRSDGAPAVAAASTSTAGLAKLHNVGESVGWVATVNPNNAVIAVINQASTVSAIIGAVETATGGVATVTVNKAPSGTACSAGTALHSGSFNANGTAATNQTLTVTTSSLAAGDRLCLQTTGTTSWTGGTGIGTITVFLAPS